MNLPLLLSGCTSCVPNWREQNTGSTWRRTLYQRKIPIHPAHYKCLDIIAVDWGAQAVHQHTMAALITWLMSTVWPQVRGLRQNKYNTPLPEQCHVTLTSDVIRGRPVLVVGDVHGCFEELRDLLEMACDERENPFVVFVGDMINKGPQSVAVLRWGQEWVFIKGTLNPRSIMGTGRYWSGIEWKMWMHQFFTQICCPLC